MGFFEFHELESDQPEFSERNGNNCDDNDF